MCIAVNGLEYVRRWLVHLPHELQIESIMLALEGHGTDNVRIQWRNALMIPLDHTPDQMLLFINQITSRIGLQV